MNFRAVEEYCIHLLAFVSFVYGLFVLFILSKRERDRDLHNEYHTARLVALNLTSS